MAAATILRRPTGRTAATVGLRQAQLQRASWVTDTRSSVLAALLLSLLSVLMIVPDGFDYAALEESVMPAAGSLVSRSVWLLLIGASLIVILRRGGLAILVLRRLNLFLLAFALLAAASVFWSMDAGVTVRRLVRVATIMLVALAFVLSGWHGQRMQSVLRGIIAALLLGSLLFGLLHPALATHRAEAAELAGAWRGLANHKNSLGALAAVGLVLWLHAALGREARLQLALPCIAIAVACLLLSRSSTALIGSVFSAAMLLLLMRSPHTLRAWIPWLVSAFTVTLLIYTLAVLRLVPGLEVLLTPVTALTGKDLSFTGRTDIWALIIDQIKEHPWLGGGYGAYWTEPLPGKPTSIFLTSLYFYPGSAHNGYMEVLNELGIMGGLCLIGFLLVYLRQSLHLYAANRELGALYLTLFFQQTVINLSESHWFNVLSFGFVVMTLATLGLARIEVERWMLIVFGPQPRPAVPTSRTTTAPTSPLRRRPA